VKSLSFLLAPLGLALPLVAQTPPVTAVTATDFGAMANANTGSDFHSIDANTAIAHGLFVAARVGGPTRTPAAMAQAHSSVMFLMPGPMGPGVQVMEAGAAAGIAATDTASSGTSGSNQSDPAPVRGAHGVSVTFAAAANVAGTVTLVWRGNATAGAAATVDVDVDGDNVVDFHGVANGTPVQQHFPVTAGAHGVVVAVTTRAAADVTGIGHENYGANLDVFFRPVATQPTVTFTAFGPSCDGTLSGQMVTTPRGNAVQLDVAGATANAFAFLMFGAQLTTPVALPGSQCQLLVENRFGGFSILDAHGDGHRVLGVPGRPPVDINFQVLTLDFSGTTLALGSTNGLNLLIQ
jgi:hypothetical protein